MTAQDAVSIAYWVGFCVGVVAGIGIAWIIEDLRKQGW